VYAYTPGAISQTPLLSPPYISFPPYIVGTPDFDGPAMLAPPPDHDGGVAPSDPSSGRLGTSMNTRPGCIGASDAGNLVAVLTAEGSSSSVLAISPCIDRLLRMRSLSVEVRGFWESD